MRSSWRLVGLLSLLALAGGCDTTQPLQLSEQTIELDLTVEEAFRFTVSGGVITPATYVEHAANKSLPQTKKTKPAKKGKAAGPPEKQN